MPVVPENIKNYFENLSRSIDSNISIDDIKDIEIRSLFPNCYVAKAISYIDEELKQFQSIPKEAIKRSSSQLIKSLELIAVIYKVNGMFTKELNSLKYREKLCSLVLDLEGKNYAIASIAFYHLIHNNKEVIPKKSVELCKTIVINEHTKRREHSFFFVDFAKVVFKSLNPDYEELLEDIETLRKNNQSYFSKSSLDTYLSRALLAYFTSVIQIKAQRLDQYKGYFSHIEPAQVSRKIAMKVLDHLKKKNSGASMHAGSYETLYYTWFSVDILLTGLHTLAEVYTMMGIDRDSKQHQYDYFKTSIIYRLPHRTKMAIHMMMHSEYINQRIPELTIRDAQLHFLETNDMLSCDSIRSSYHSAGDSGIDGYNMPLQINDYDEFGTNLINANRRRATENPALIYVISADKGVSKELPFEECFLKKSIWRDEMKELLDVLRRHIWKVQPDDKKFQKDTQWEKLFIQPREEKENLCEEFRKNATLKTPENSPIKSSNIRNRCAPMNAPIRAVRRQLQMGPAHIKKPLTRSRKRLDGDSNVVDDDDDYVDGCSTVVIPYKARNIRYELPELPRSLMYDNNVLDVSSSVNQSLSFADVSSDSCYSDSTMDSEKLGYARATLNASVAADGLPSLIDYLEKHAALFRFMHVPVMHRPVFQRLALHYLSKDDQLQAAFNLSMSINIGFRQSYQQTCSLKARLKNDDSTRWSMTADVVSHCLVGERNMHAVLEDVLPERWTVLQLAMIDEVRLVGAEHKSSLLDGPSGGCLGARNVAYMLVTKYQSRPEGLQVHTRVIHGFKKTGIQLMDTMERYKMKNVEALAVCEKREWWKKRFDIDVEIDRLIKQMRNDWFTEDDLDWLLDNGDGYRSEPKILITDRHLGRIPWEAVLSDDNSSIPRCLSRMPNLIAVVGHLTQIRFRKTTKMTRAIRRVNLEIDPFNAFFLVNPDSSLQGTEDTLLPMFKERLKWDGVTGSSGASIDCTQILNSRDMTIYCGHGSGSKYLTDKHMKQITSPTALFLIGCYSARYLIEGRSEATSVMMRYLTNGCPTVLGLQWDVTDREIDRYTQQLLAAWLTKEDRWPDVHSDTYEPVAPLSSYVFSGKTADGLRLRTLTGKSTILYGLPVWIDHTAVVPDLSV